jgi:hypothetical protein
MRKHGASTFRRHALPKIRELKQLCQVIVVIDLIHNGWTFLYEKDDEGDVIRFSMDNGSGDHYSIFFTKDGAIIMGDAHEFVMNPHSDVGRERFPNGVECWPGVIDEIPEDFRHFLDNFQGDDEYILTYCIWAKYPEEEWTIGEEIDFPEGYYEGEPPDGSEDFIYYLDGKIDNLFNFIEEYYGLNANTNNQTIFYYQFLEDLIKHKPLTKEMIELINPEVINDEGKLEEFKESISNIGYPLDF